MALKRSTILLAAFATFAFVAADAAPSLAQSVAPTRTTPGDGGGDSGGGGGGGTPTRPGGNDGGGTDGGGNDGSSSSMPSYGCSGYGWANMPAYCVTAALACACPTETSKNYRKPASCGSITPNQRKAAERQCYQAGKVSYRPRS